MITSRDLIAILKCGGVAGLFPGYDDTFIIAVSSVSRTCVNRRPK
jgi:hypothetical protein